ncbi:hypothetical protein CARUB_v10003728mg [Capsella rubella]|uniref:RING-type E3 ubiquitin transferase n=1 Tax=Capsella rubella TaxID=81985 RepID=R0FC99_9BRAS|nr:E3 ubiquitin-protein ligase SINA-like 7 [Capsella rubella]EOA19712.1 hypothetical protein CARUB_v10003728mg [Capsella rubella]
MECASSDVNSLSNTHLQETQQTEDKPRSTILNLDLLDCPICVEPFTIPIFQCDNGHLACASCCPKLMNKCPACALPIGNFRCRAMENVLESISVPCPNAKLGCTKNITYGTESTHVKECPLSLCMCPVPKCDYQGTYNDLYGHLDSHILDNIGKYYFPFALGKVLGVYVDLNETALTVMKGNKEGLLFAVHCVSKANGVYVTVGYIAPCSMDVGEFSCDISTTVEQRTIAFKSMKVKNIQKLSSKIPREDFMLVPSYFMSGRRWFMLKICVTKLNQ